MTDAVEKVFFELGSSESHRVGSVLVPLGVTQSALGIQRWHR